MIAATIACALACVALVIAEWRGRARLRVAAKVIASLSFLLVGGLACERTGDAFGAWIAGGLALGVVGDVALLGAGTGAFVAGLGAFLLGHLAYVVAIGQLAPPRLWLAPRAAAPIAAGLAALAYLWPRLGRLRVAVIAYVATIVTMVIAALAVRDRPRLAAGAVLFFASDLAVARDRFVAKSFANKAWGLPAYYAGQLLLAWSIAT